MAVTYARKIEGHILDKREPPVCGSTNTFTKETAEDKVRKRWFPAAPAVLEANGQSSSSSYMLADDRSQFSRDIEHWMNGSQLPTPTSLTTASPTSTDNNNIQGGRVPATVQRSVLARSLSSESTGIWYLLAMVLPLFSIHNCPQWRCTPSLVLNSAELLMTHFSRVCGRMRDYLRQLSQDQVAREIFATAMDVVLVIYAVGFLILSMYQASIFV